MTTAYESIETSHPYEAHQYRSATDFISSAGSPALSRARTADRALVHRASIHEVFVTESMQLTSDRYAVAVQWPRRHHLGDWGTSERLSSTLVLEAVRQIGLMLPHQYLEVPLDAIYLARSLGFSWLDRPIEFHGSAIDATALATLGHRSQANGRSKVLELSVTLMLPDGSPFATGEGSMTTIPPAVYRRLRGRATLASSAHLARPSSTPLPPNDVALQRHDQVVVSPHPDSANPSLPTGVESAEVALRIDSTSPFYFDHPYDHVPGTLLLDGMQQAASLLRGGREPSGVRADFARYVELTPPPTVRVTADGPDDVIATVAQQGDVVATGSVAFAPPATSEQR